MLCDECHKNEAAYTMSVMSEGEVRTRHLCQDCHRQLTQKIRAGGLSALLSAILKAISEHSAEEEGGDAGLAFDLPEELTGEKKEGPELACPVCHTTLSSFTRTGRLGCPACYQAFRQELQPILMQIHGHVTHAGRVPVSTQEARRHRSRQEELTRQMAQAVAQEDYETAAALRDQLKAISEERES